MADVLTPEQRHRNMVAIRSRNTKPEMVVRRVAHSLGFRFRLHRKDLPGKPDLVFPRFRKVILVHGCFWHMHDCPAGRVTPKTNAEFWQRKRHGNVERDARTAEALKALGWAVLDVWECQTKDTELVKNLLADFLKNEN